MKQFLGEKVTLFGGDNRDVLKEMPDNCIDSIVTDPPYALVSIVKRFGKPGSAPAKGNEAFMRASKGFMGKEWDTGEVAFDPEFWAECLRVLKPGGHIISFGGTRTYHRMACAIEDAGFEIRDMIQWLYGSGFPKSHDVSKGIDKAAGAAREVVGIKVNTYDGASRDPSKHGNPADQSNIGKWGLTQTPHGMPLTAPATTEAAQWQGWGTALKPANEPIVLARKPLSEKTVAANVLKWGTGAINIDGCRVGVDAEDANHRAPSVAFDGKGGIGYSGGLGGRPTDNLSSQGRWPANVIHDGSDEVIAAFPDSKSCNTPSNAKPEGRILGGARSQGAIYPGENGSAARFFYQAKANKKDRANSKHPTVKPINLLRYLIRLITPHNGVVFDPFAGSGTTGEAAYIEGFRAILIEREAEYQEDIANRLKGLDNVIDRTEDEVDTTDATAQQ